MTKYIHSWVCGWIFYPFSKIVFLSLSLTCQTVDLPVSFPFFLLISSKKEKEKDRFFANAFILFLVLFFRLSLRQQQQTTTTIIIIIKRMEPEIFLFYNLCTKEGRNNPFLSFGKVKRDCIINNK